MAFQLDYQERSRLRRARDWLSALFRRIHDRTAPAQGTEPGANYARLQAELHALEAQIIERTAELRQLNTLTPEQVPEPGQGGGSTPLKHADLLQQVANAIISTDMQFHIQTWNRAAQVMYGWREDEVIGRYIADVMQPTFPGSTVELVRDQLLRDGEWKGEIIHTCKDGSLLPIFASVVFVLDEDGQRIGTVSVNHDMTKLKALQQAEREQRRLAEALRDAAAAVNSSLNLDTVLERILDHVGSVVPYDSANIMLIEDDVARIVRGKGYEERGLPMSHILGMRFPLKDYPVLIRMVRTQQSEIIADTDTHPDWRQSGSRIDWMHSYLGAPIVVEGEVIGFLNLDSVHLNGFTDLQAEHLQAFANQTAIAIHNARLYDEATRHAEELEQRVSGRTAELERQGAQLVTILDSMNEGVVGIMFGEDGKPSLHYINQSFAEMTGFTAEEWTNQPLCWAYSGDEPDAEMLQSFNDAMNESGFWERELKLRRKDGTEFYAFASVTRVTDLDEQVIGLVTVVQDITQRKLLDEQRSRFVANASHELRTPITNLITRLHLLRKQPEHLSEHLDILEKVAERLRKLVNDLLEYARLERGMIPLNYQQIDLRALVDDVVRLQQPEAEAKHIQLSYPTYEHMLLVSVDPDRMVQVFTNLVTNAIHYTPEGGTITIEYEVEPSDIPGMARVVVHVRDTGVGIAEEALPHIFQPFYRGNDQREGTGLGLSIAKEIVDAHGGAIHATSTPGEGSCFTVYLSMLDSSQT